MVSEPVELRCLSLSKTPNTYKNSKNNKNTVYI